LVSFELRVENHKTHTRELGEQDTNQRGKVECKQPPVVSSIVCRDEEPGISQIQEGKLTVR
jgi:hypothetical protein